MNIKIKKLTPEMAADYVHFFDVTPHDDAVYEHKCYCVMWSQDDYAGQDLSSAEARRAIALQNVKDGKIQGYLAYYDDKIVGWCNANTRSECLKCQGGVWYMSDVPKDDPGVKVKSVFCFVIAPEMRRKGISKLFLEEVCRDATLDGFDYVESYPNKEFNSERFDYMGPIRIYEECGFIKTFEWDTKVIMRKALHV
ncbi:MAG: GNAT family N-acetyltransferase [Spirochaetaceae bacterium]|jgi:GNAT superfamily N-acetyltransferase|nr:GNAT family N-acetyltransferase [Spirochaetaceae bacterium]